MNLKFLLMWTVVVICFCLASTSLLANDSNDDGNLLPDYSLESLAAFDWTGSSAAVEQVNTDARTGRSCLRVVDQSGDWGQGNSALLPMAPGRYFAETWVRIDQSVGDGGLSHGGVAFGIQFFDSDNSYLSTQELGVANARTWTRISGEVLVPDNASSISFRILPTSPNESIPRDQIAPAIGACFVDDFYFAPLDAASEAGLLKPRRQSEPKDEAGAMDESLVLHYRFDQDPGEIAIDLSGYGNDGKIIDGRYLDEVDGRRGVLRFNGETAYIDCGNSESMLFTGDRSFEMWVRFNQPEEGPNYNWPLMYGEYPPDKFAFNMPYSHTLSVWYRNLENTNEATWVPVDKNLIDRDQRWTHIAVVIEYPRCRFYKNGQLYHDAYMPFSGVMTNTDAASYHQHIGGGPDATYAAPIDLTEFRLYRRALPAEEIAAHAAGQELAPPPSIELAVEPNWYKDQVTLRMTAKGGKYKAQTAKFIVREAADQSVVAYPEAVFSEALPGSGRYTATATIALSNLKERVSYQIASRIDGTNLKVERELKLEKPEWINSQAGISDKVLLPWTSVKTEQRADKTIDVGVWGRNYHFDANPFVSQIKVHDQPILAAPITLTGQVDGKAINWKGSPARLTAASDTTASLDQKLRSGSLSLHVVSEVEYDGFTTIECELKAEQDVSLDELTLEIPIRSKYAQFCGGDYVLPKKPNVSMSAMYRGKVKDDLSFRFGPSVWLGTDEGGLCWQAESDEDWHYRDQQRAIEILPRGQATHFKAHFIDIPTKLVAGQTLRYKFALQATPLKPLYRDAWDLRIARSEPYGADLDLPGKTMNDKQMLEHLADIGIRHLFINVNDDFPWPLPRRQVFKDKLHRLNEEVHDAGLKIYCYSIHVRVPIMRPEYDIYGSDMLLRPARQYMQAVSAIERPGPLPWKQDMLPLPQGSADFCQKSDALQDAYMHALNKRVTDYGDDGVYLDGSYVTEPCINTEHDCGYYDKDGVLHPTYPVFAARKFMKRIYTIVHENKPEGVVDLHSSFFLNVSGMAYADVIWTGEQWYELRHTGADYISGTLSLDQFRTEFTGWPFGLPAETLCYRLGPPMKVAAISLLHDISPRYISSGYDILSQNVDPYHALMPTIWKLREDFGVKEANKLFYFENAEYVTVSPDKCYATLFKHPTNGVLALISNLSPELKEVSVVFNLDKLGLDGARLNVVNALTGDPVSMTTDGALSILLDSESWLYVWLQAQN